MSVFPLSRQVVLGLTRSYCGLWRTEVCNYCTLHCHLQLLVASTLGPWQSTCCCGNPSEQQSWRERCLNCDQGRNSLRKAPCWCFSVPQDPNWICWSKQWRWEQSRAGSRRGCKLWSCQESLASSLPMSELLLWAIPVQNSPCGHWQPRYTKAFQKYHFIHQIQLWAVPLV